MSNFEYAARCATEDGFLPGSHAWHQMRLSEDKYREWKKKYAGPNSFVFDDIDNLDLPKLETVLEELKVVFAAEKLLGQPTTILSFLEGYITRRKLKESPPTSPLP